MYRRLCYLSFAIVISNHFQESIAYQEPFAPSRKVRGRNFGRLDAGIANAFENMDMGLVLNDIIPASRGKHHFCFLSLIKAKNNVSKLKVVILE